MSLTTLKSHEFIIRLDNDPKAAFDPKQELNIELVNPHKVGEYRLDDFAMLKVLIRKLNAVKEPAKPEQDFLGAQDIIYKYFKSNSIFMPRKDIDVIIKAMLEFKNTKP